MKASRIRVATHILPFITLIGALLLSTGCVKESVDGTTFRYTFESWVSLGALAGGIVAIPLGLVLRNKIARLGWALIIGGPVLLILLVPGLFRDEVVVTLEGFQLRTGIWFCPTNHDVSFADVSGITIDQYATRGRRGRRGNNMDLLIRNSTGGTERVPVGDLMKRGGLAKILEVAKSRSIPIEKQDRR